MLDSIVAGSAAACAAVTAGVYANFSARVMPRLAALPDAEGIAAMQGFNRNAVQPPFMTAFFGAAVLGAALIVRIVRTGERTLAEWLGATGAVLYLTGFVLTVVYHVPRNDRLAAVDPSSSSAVVVWRDYLAEWTAANTVRGALSVLATGALACAAVAFAQRD